jgi:hypothetical protein
MSAGDDERDPAENPPQNDKSKRSHEATGRTPKPAEKKPLSAEEASQMASIFMDVLRQRGPDQAPELPSQVCDALWRLFRFFACCMLFITQWARTGWLCAEIASEVENVSSVEHAVRHCKATAILWSAAWRVGCSCLVGRLLTYLVLDCFDCGPGKGALCKAHRIAQCFASMLAIALLRCAPRGQGLTASSSRACLTPESAWILS